MAAIADRMASSIRVPPSRGFSPDFFSYFPRRKRKASRQNSPKPGQDKLLCTRWVGAPALAQICFILKHCPGNAALPALTVGQGLFSQLACSALHWKHIVLLPKYTARVWQSKGLSLREGNKSDLPPSHRPNVTKRHLWHRHEEDALQTSGVPTALTISDGKESLPHHLPYCANESELKQRVEHAKQGRRGGLLQNVDPEEKESYCFIVPQLLNLTGC